MASDGDRMALFNQVLNTSWIRAGLLLVVGILAVAAVISAGIGRFRIASQLATVVSAFVTILLVLITAQYAEQTRNLVEESRQTREQNQEFREARHERELRSLRIALREEIGKVQYYNQLAEDYESTRSMLDIDAPDTVYKSNAGDIGLLTEEEVDAVVEYYTRLQQIQATMELQRTVDVPVDMHPLKEWYRRFEVLWNLFLYKITFGRFGSRGPKVREELIRQQFDELTKAQEVALERLEAHL